MKAVITSSKNDVLDLKIKLISEGANDRTLLRLLEQQHPTILTLDADVLEVSIVEKFEFHDGCEFVVSRQPLPYRNTGHFSVMSDPWDGGILRDAVLKIDPLGCWQVKRFLINGRERPHAGPWDVYPGAVVQLHLAQVFDESVPQEQIDQMIASGDVPLFASLVPLRRTSTT